MNKKDQWTNEALNSLEGIKKAIPGDELLARVMDQLPKTNLMPKWQIGLTAVAASLLILLNIYVLDSDVNEPSSRSSTEYVRLVDDFSLYQ